MPAERAILHVDMDAFFAAIEQLDDPALRGKPILVGFDGPRGVVTTASYEARPFGCHSAQPMSVAKRKCPQAIVVPVRGARYREVSGQVFDTLREFTPAVEPISIDEAFMDVTGSQRLLGDAIPIARRLKVRVTERTGLTASVGVAPNKFLAKLASDMDKPDGLTVIEPETIRSILDPLPISRMWGVGPATERVLAEMSIVTFGDARRLPEATLAGALGEMGRRIYRLVRGLDERPVHTGHDTKSISHEQTFGADIAEPDRVRRVLLGQVEAVGRRLRKAGLRARGVTVKIRFGQFQTITRSASFEEPTDETDRLWSAARDLFDKWSRQSFEPVRLIGMGATRLSEEGEQSALFADDTSQRQQRIDRTTDDIRDRFGKAAIRRGGTLSDASTKQSQAHPMHE
jgi:nucleotidyltransferase/DNA polymerase involved in DNA repair